MRIVYLLALGMITISHPASADKLDGDWCEVDGASNLHIDGSRIVTPTGAETEGDYRRHYFSYVVPAGDPDAGETVEIRQVHDSLMILTPPGGPDEEWQRCDLHSS